MSQTICAIATPPGSGGIHIIRLSGDSAEAVLSRVFRPASGQSELTSHVLTFGHVMDGPEQVDECMAVLMKAPRSYTREDVAELQIHGGQAVASRVLTLCLQNGAVLAQPGEFTRRAFENGRIDLSQAEAVMRLVSARGEQARQAAMRQLEGGTSAFIRQASEDLYGIQAAFAAAIDYPEEISEEEALSGMRPRILALADSLLDAVDERGAEILNHGLRVALCGRPNVGKSSLLNALLREDRAIVTPVAGTTRDTVTGEISLGGSLIRLTDTAGIRDTADTVERLGVERARRAIEEADCLLLVLDGSEPLSQADLEMIKAYSSRTVMALISKADLPAAWPEEALPAELARLRLSVRRPESLQPLRAWLQQQATVSDQLVLTQPRHIEAARRAAQHLRAAADAMAVAVDLAGMDLLAAQQALAEITGDRVEESLLDRVFADFCVGK